MNNLNNKNEHILQRELIVILAYYVVEFIISTHISINSLTNKNEHRLLGILAHFIVEFIISTNWPMNYELFNKLKLIAFIKDII